VDYGTALNVSTEIKMISIEGLNKAQVLAALYNASKPLGMGIIHFDPKDMTEEEAQKEIDIRLEFDSIYFDYLKGRVMKVDLTSDSEFDPYLYDRDNGEGAAQEVIDQLRKELVNG
jgi:hypothetical protein